MPWQVTLFLSVNFSWCKLVESGFIGLFNLCFHRTKTMPDTCIEYTEVLLLNESMKSLEFGQIQITAASDD